MAEKKYIERGILFDNFYKVWGTEIDGGICNSFMEIVNSTPTADVQPIVRGKWIKDESGVIYCSECGEEHEWIEFRANFCDNCGADMREVRNGEIIDA